jgi:23S rRNA (cytidine1920-2'-O)/16S rRNA (cytidine1409-2'-O)-methyltransferase
LGRRAHPRLRRLDAELVRLGPELEDVTRLVTEGWIIVDGHSVTNPASLVRTGASIVVQAPRPLRGEAKLQAALTAFRVPVRDRIALDVGAAAGGFTRVLLAAGARRVYAVDAGHGQLLGSLRQDRRVVNLEGVNLGELTRAHVPEPIELVTLDLSYLAIARAAPQLESVELDLAADLVALVKPMFELRTSRPPEDRAEIRTAVGRAEEGLAHAGWEPQAAIESPVRGSRGAVEWLIHARRRPPEHEADCHGCQPEGDVAELEQSSAATTQAASQRPPAPTSRTPRTFFIRLSQ